MAAEDNLSPQFQEQGVSPLDYHGQHPHRAALVDPNLPPPSPKEHMFAEQRSKTYTSPETGRRLKKPREIIHPGAEPGTASFADYTNTRPGEIFIHYMKTRSDQQGHGHATRLVNDLIAQHKPKYVDFGKVMNEQMDAVRQKVEAQHPDMQFHHKRFF